MQASRSCSTVETTSMILGHVGFLSKLNPKISRPFWWILGLKYVLIDMWGNDKNEMMFFYFQP
jgi:hypothetical protein